MPEPSDAAEVKLDVRPGEHPKAEVIVPPLKGKPGVGLDVGTMWVVGSRFEPDGKVRLRSVRDCYFEVERDYRGMLNLAKDAQYMELGDRFYLLGDTALNVGNMFGKELRRPLQRGAVAPGDFDAQKVLLRIFNEVVGKAQAAGEPCCFSTPGDVVDSPDGRDMVYHQEVVSHLLGELGYKPVAVNEALAVCFAECSQEDYSGITISFGSGLVNVAITYRTVCGISFAIERGGDWIDKNVAIAVASTASRCCALKEKGVSISDWKKGEERDAPIRQAIAAYYKNMVVYVIRRIREEFHRRARNFAVPEPIPVVLAGGTALAGGFAQMFQQAFQEAAKDFPIRVKEVRMAKSPLHAVAQGLLAYSTTL